MSSLKVVAISDTHGMHGAITIPECDLLLHAGDMTMNGYESQVCEVARWLADQPAKHKVAVAGNHDWWCERSPDLAKDYFALHGVSLLFNETIEVEGMKIFGSPYQRWFHDWAFNFPENDLDHAAAKICWSFIKPDTDIIITHGPAYGLVDKVSRIMYLGEDPHVGCPVLRDRVEVIKPKLFVCGHIHEAYALDEHTVPGVIVVNAAICTFPGYRPTNKPVEIKL